MTVWVNDVITGGERDRRSLYYTYYRPNCCVGPRGCGFLGLGSVVSSPIARYGAGENEFGAF